MVLIPDVGRHSPQLVYISQTSVDCNFSRLIKGQHQTVNSRDKNYECYTIDFIKLLGLKFLTEDFNWLLKINNLTL